MAPQTKNTIDLCRKLKRLPIFWRIGEEGVVELINLMQFSILKPNELIFEENSPGDSFYIILSGEVVIYKCIEKEGITEEISLATMGENMIFGEMTLLAPGKRTAAAKTTCLTTMLKLDKKSFKSALDGGQVFAFKLAYNIGCIVCERLRLMDDRLLNVLQENKSLKFNKLIQSIT